MSSKPIKHKPATFVSRELYTPKPEQHRVMLRHLNGESNRQIAVGERLDRATVSRILSQEELVATIADQQSCLLSLGYKAIGLYLQALDCDDIRTALKAATKILEGSGVINKRGLQGTIEDARRQALSDSPSKDCVWPPVEVQVPLELVPIRENPDCQLFLEGLVDDFGPDDGSSEPSKLSAIQDTSRQF